MATPPQRSVLIIGHGTRDEGGQRAFAEVVHDVAAAQPAAVVEGCFLELVEPNIGAGIARAVERGAREIAVVPLLLVAAGHARRDVPEQIATAIERFADVKIWQTPHIGSHPAMLELSELRYRQALAAAPAMPEESLLIVVGRGTNDPRANAELCNFAHLRHNRTRVGRCEACFLSMTKPSLVETLELAASLPFRRIVVQPHFLFRGELLDRIKSTVAAASRSGNKEFLVTECLGNNPLLVQAIADLADREPAIDRLARE